MQIGFTSFSFSQIKNLEKIIIIARDSGIDFIRKKDVAKIKAKVGK